MFAALHVVARDPSDGEAQRKEAGHGGCFDIDDRKTASVLTVGLIDFRSDKERIARSSKKTAKEAEKQTELMRQMVERQGENDRDSSR